MRSFSVSSCFLRVAFFIGILMNIYCFEMQFSLSSTQMNVL